MYDNTGTETSVFSDPTPGGSFGAEITTDGTYIFIADPDENISRGSTVYEKAGVVYVFESDGDYVATLQASEPASNRNFGRSLAAYQDTSGSTDLLVGGNEAAFLYAGLQVASAGDPVELSVEGLPAQSDFGFSVAIYGDLALVGAPQYVVDGIETGGAFLYNISGTSPVLLTVTAEGGR